jgi:hypothetical protein
MAWLETVLARLSDAPEWGYVAAGPTAAEPAALSALALTAHGRHAAARAPLDWLRRQQAADGSVGALGGDPDPAWPTAWSVLAWQAAAGLPSSDRSRNDSPGNTTRGRSQETAVPRSKSNVPGNATHRDGHRAAAQRGVDWLLEARGKPLEKTLDLGHNCALIGWPWVLGTHSWMEPTAMAVLALKATARRSHARTLEAVRLLIDRLLPDGGCNYGNTEVLGQMLRPHVQPTGLCLWALAGEPDADGRIARARDYLAREIVSQEATASLSYGLLGLAAHGVRPPQAERLLASAAERTLRRTPVAYRLALLALAAPHAGSPFLPDTLPTEDFTPLSTVLP